ncbi:substrate of the Dot/Icm secretion system [Legionella gratiana]|uniref:Dot/Icm secretion system substrate n=1 Tax=Legionella gratiana TaxID=45066 RepID=A0A378J1X2_9GAMM|nr:Dot/Icm T4SS effector AnkD/LegA15 [Legionella gratiana]KTD14648.1 substrate of the Dot/Icm secretion system [Legionella gratiana]STX41615.1 Dot/Icm secretion system substrate [Legionella gratiana]
MPELSAPSSTITSHSDVVNDKLKDKQNTKADEERFMLELFVVLQKKNDLLLNQQFDQLQVPLKEIAQDCGYQDLPTALSLAKNARGQTALVKALQDQEFSLANALLMSGAQFDNQALAEFDIAIDSEKGRQALADGTIQLPSSYRPSDRENLHLVKEYGLVLGIEMTSKDGTPSQRAHIGPAYKLMTESVSDYSKSCSSQPVKDDFKQIANAFNFTNSVSKFHGSNPTGSPEAGNALAKRIQAGEITTVPINCKGHAMGLSFAPVAGDPNKTYLIVTNRGEGAEKTGKFGTQIYEVDKRDVTPEFINKMMNGHYKGQSHDEIMGRVAKVTKGKEPVYDIPQSQQKYDNCTVANSRSNIQGILACQEANRKGGFDKVNKEEIKDRYKGFTDDMKSKKVQELGKALAKDPDNPDLKNLAQGYLDKPGGKFKHHLETAMNKDVEPSIRMKSP